MPRFHFLLVLVALAAPAFAADPVGWRRDGTGIYPNTDPPLHWSQVSKSLQELRQQADRPAGEDPSGRSMADGVIREWLVLGPIADSHDEKKIPTDPLFAVDQSRLAPTAGDQAVGAAWKSVSLENSFLDFATLLDAPDKPANPAAYALTYIYSPQNAALVMSINHTGAACGWLNGKLLQKLPDMDMNYSAPSIPLVKGWNRLLFRVTPSRANNGKTQGMWHFNPVLRATPKDAAYDQQNIRWRTTLPSANSFSPPVVTKGKIFLLSDPTDLVCLDQATGKILWVRSNNYDELATPEEKQAHADIFNEIQPLQATLKQINDSFASTSPPKIVPIEGREGYKEKLATEKKLYDLMKQVGDKKYLRPKGQEEVGFAGTTPITDGQFVWAWFATGVTCCYDLDGKLIWRRLDNEGSFFEHGYSVSPQMADGKIIVFMNKLIAFDARTGERLWTTDLSGIAQTRFHGTPAIAKIAGAGGGAVCILPTGNIVRLSDGKMIHDKGPDISNRQQEIPSPVVLNNTVYELSTFSIFNKVDLPPGLADPLVQAAVQTVKFDVSHYPTFYNEWFLSSPLIHEGLAYCLNNTGVLVVIDVATMKVVYEKLLDLDQYGNANTEAAARGVGASPTLAGNNIYLVGNSGVTLVLKPGRTYQQLARNKIESVVSRGYGLRHERFAANPVFDGNQLFLRSERNLYCISEE